MAHELPAAGDAGGRTVRREGPAVSEAGGRTVRQEVPAVGVAGARGVRREVPAVDAEAHTVPQERVEPERIEPETEPTETPEAPAKERGRWWRGFTGSLAAGLTVLALGVLVVAGFCLYTGAPGPGATLLIGHPIAAVLALLAQRVADRRNGPAAAGAGVAVVLFTVSALTLFWLT
ncbi:hypothetical protein [Amycolatopsis sp. SID8362]|uniref:hypothetical protein n=1 Tax=Amycolatopsis sp. SID8362 TaxID=2690346 RepID=UPI002816036F|nr:hypothetical protein [Amycolatopsis sp. SID8362]